MNAKRGRRKAGCRRRLSVALLLAAASAGAVEVVPSATPQQVFGDGARAVEVRFRNDAAEPARVALRFHLFQLTSATTAPVGGARAWKSLTVLPGQTVVEHAPIEFPAVRVSTRFAARWLGTDGKLLGVTEIWAHPDNLLAGLKPLAGGQPIGLMEATPNLRPALVMHGLSVTEPKAPEDWRPFRGRLAFVVAGPKAMQGELRLEPSLLAHLKEGLAVVWFQTPPKISPPVLPIVERMRVGRGTVLLAPASLLDGLADSPAAQLALVRLAEQALTPPAQLLAATP